MSRAGAGSAVSVRDALDGATTAIAAGGSPSPRLDAEVLLAEVLGVSRGRLHSHPEAPVEGLAVRAYQSFVRRRSVLREPVAYILGRRGFRRIELTVDPCVLIPRPETEHLVEVGLELAVGARVLDLATGSGAVALALADERPDLLVTGSDRSRPALEVARANAVRLGLDVTWHEADLLDGVDGRWDAILSNPPYIPTDVLAGLEPEVSRHEPALALDGGADGLDVIRPLIGAVGATPTPLLALEIGAGQADAVGRLLRAAGFADVEVRRDLADIERVVVGRRAAADVEPVVENPAVSQLDRCVAAGGVVVFPADTVYGLGCDPENADAVARVYELKGRPGGKPAAVMWGRLSSVLAELDELGRRTRRALELLLPGPVTVLVANPRARFPLAGSGLLGVRVPLGGLDLDGRLLQTSANLAGGPDSRRLADVPQAIRDGADLLLDGGDLPGVPSTVVDLSRYDEDGSWRVVRVGALAADEVRDRLAGAAG